MSKKKTTSNSEKRKQEKGSAPNGDSQLAAGGELHQIAGGEHPRSPPTRASRFPIIKTRSGPIRAALRFWRISSFAKKSRISITSVFPSVSFTRERRACMDSSS